tara:strand:+ start:828 stop:1109 length:282 start_codon:yes stop_codon:yes gene_type:complete
MAALTDLIGKYAIHPHYGEVFVDSAPKRSRVMLNITVTQRGKGWNDAIDKYERYMDSSRLQEDGSRSLRWKTTRRDEYGVKDTVHVKTLTLKN